MSRVRRGRRSALHRRRRPQGRGARRAVQRGVPIVTEKNPTNLVWDPSSTSFFLLETRLRGAESRNRIRERLSRTGNPGNHAASPESLGASRLPSFAKAFLNRCHPEDRCFFRVYYRNPVASV